MTSPKIKLSLVIDVIGADAEETDELANHLRSDLLDLGAESVDRVSGGTPPEGARGDPLLLGALVLAVVPALLPKIVEFLQGWALRSRDRKIRIKTPDGLEVEFSSEKKYSEAELFELVEKMIETTED